jgi:hypothetical protein
MLILFVCTIDICNLFLEPFLKSMYYVSCTCLPLYMFVSQTYVFKHLSETCNYICQKRAQTFVRNVYILYDIHMICLI